MSVLDRRDILHFAAIVYTFTLPALIFAAVFSGATLTVITQPWFGLYALTVSLTAVKWVGKDTWKAVKEMGAAPPQNPDT